MLEKLKRYPLLVLFAVFLLVTSVADMFVNRRAFSELENRYLAQKPKFVLSEMLENKYTPKYEEYVNDQFIGRDQWITLKSVSESAMGKIENNGIIYGKEHHLFENYRSLDEQRLAMNIGFMKTYLENYKDQTNLTLAIVPSSYQVLQELVPRGLNNVDQKTRIEEVYAALPSEGIQKLDMVKIMGDMALSTSSGKNTQSYYRTDHHWTTQGAYNGYKAFVESRGMQAVPFSELESYRQTVPDFYGTYFSKCKLFSAVPDTIVYYDIPVDSVNIAGEEKGSLYDSSKWEERDKHAAFLWGNNDMTVIKSTNNQNHVDEKTSRILLIKDSFGNSFAPFLTYNYDEVYVVDLRHLKEKMSALMERVPFDDVLILYNFMNFSSDTNIGYISY